MFQTIVNEKCNNVTNMKLKEDFVLFGKAKDFKSDEIFDFIILFARFFIYKREMENKRHIRYFKYNWQQGIKRRHIYHNYVNMEHASFRSKWLCL